MPDLSPPPPPPPLRHAATMIALSTAEQGEHYHCLFACEGDDGWDFMLFM
jgi:hypothetical protein